MMLLFVVFVALASWTLGLLMGLDRTFDDYNLYSVMIMISLNIVIIVFICLVIKIM